MRGLFYMFLVYIEHNQNGKIVNYFIQLCYGISFHH